MAQLLVLTWCAFAPYMSRTCPSLQASSAAPMGQGQIFTTEALARAWGLLLTRALWSPGPGETRAVGKRTPLLRLHTHISYCMHMHRHTHKHTTHTHAHVHARTYTHTQAHSNTRTDMLCRVLLYCPRLHLPADKRERERLVSLFAKKPAPTNVSVYCTETEVCGSGVWGVGVRGRLCVLHKSQDLLEARADVPHSCPGACMK